MIINEVAWAGTAAPNAGGSDEWIELFNAGTATVDVTGWALYEGSVRIIGLVGTIAPGSYYLIERTDDTAISDIIADLSGPFGGAGLKNLPAGEDLKLLDAGGGVADEVSCATAWFAGSASPDYATMERIDADSPGSDASNWATNDGSVMVGADVSGGPIRGTPAHSNSVTAAAS